MRGSRPSTERLRVVRTGPDRSRDGPDRSARAMRERQTRSDRARRKTAEQATRRPLLGRGSGGPAWRRPDLHVPSARHGRDRFVQDRQAPEDLQYRARRLPRAAALGARGGPRLGTGARCRTGRRAMRRHTPWPERGRSAGLSPRPQRGPGGPRLVRAVPGPVRPRCQAGQRLRLRRSRRIDVASLAPLAARRKGDQM